VYFTAKGPDKYYHGVRSADGWKLFADRVKTTEGVEFTSSQDDYYERALLTSYTQYGETVEFERELASKGGPSPPLRDRWDALLGELEEARGGLTSESTEQLSDEMEAQLRELGYLDDITE
jgi:hypothetical protein